MAVDEEAAKNKGGEGNVGAILRNIERAWRHRSFQNGERFRRDSDDESASRAPIVLQPELAKLAFNFEERD